MKLETTDSLTYWLDHFNEEWEMAHFPYDLIEFNPAENNERKTLRYNWSGLVYNDLLRVSGKSPAGLLMILMSGLSELLYRYTGVENMVIGMPGIHDAISSNERRPVLPISISHIRNQSFKDLLLGVKETVTEALNHQSYSYTELINTLNKGNSIVDTLIMLEPLHKSYPNLDTPPSILFKFEITDSSLIGEINFSTKLFAERSIKQIAIHLEHLLIRLLQNPTQKLSDISLVSDVELTGIADMLEGDKNFDYMGHTLDQLFQKQVARTPSQTAITYMEQSLSYLEIDKKSNSTARYLQNKGFSSGDFIGIMTSDPVDIAISILGILKAGCVYVPIDPQYPEERIQYILKHSGIKGVILDKSDTSVAIPNHIESLAVELALLENDDEFHSLSRPENLAYIIYTSGSTGRPKGVEIEHRSIGNSLLWRKQEYALKSTDRILQLLSFAFDGFIMSFFTPLLSGAESIFPSTSEKQDPFILGSYITKHQISHFISTPSLFNELLEHPESRSWSSLRVVTLAGEPIERSTLMKSCDILPNLEIANEYGPTENSVVTTCQRNVERASRISIGRPVANSKLFILDADGNNQPFGIPGELCVSGYGVARGYLNNSQLTDSRFLPVSSGEKTKMYLTGDVVRLFSDGSLEYIGRKDQQVKIRGYRIELGEITSALLKHDQVNEAVVKVFEGTHHEKSLCAYVSGEITEISSVLKIHLSGLLPVYMIPEHIVKVNKLPKNTNGKVDLNSLPDPISVSESNCWSDIPVTEMEVEVHQLWCDLLGREAIAVEENLFQLGAHSLKIASFISHTYRKFKVVLTVSVVFQNPTIRGLSKIIQGETRKILTPLRKMEHRPYYPLSSAQRRLYFLNKMTQESTHYNMPGAVVLKGKIDESKIKETLRQLVNRHEVLRTSFEWQDGKPVQRIVEDLEPDYQYEVISEKTLDRHLESFVKPFNLEQAPLFRVKFLRLSVEKYMLLLDMHHIISDGLSIQIILNDFIKLYDRKELEPLIYQYKDYAVWQEEFLSTELSAKQIAYWSNKLAGDLPVLELPLDFPRKVEKSYRGETVSFHIDNTVILELRKKYHGKTLFTVLLSIYYISLAKYTGQEDIIVGTPVAGRSRQELEPVVGMFVNTLAIRNFPEKSKTVFQFVEEVQQSVVNAFDNQDVPFEVLVERLQVTRTLNRNPIFDTMFALQVSDKEKDRHVIDGLTAERFQMLNHTSKFDLSLHVSDTSSGVVIHVEYDNDLFTKEKIERFCLHYKSLVKELYTNPEAPIKELCMLQEQEKGDLVQFGKGLLLDHIFEQTLVDRFRKQAEFTPDYPALLYGDQVMSYRELEIA
ncbi:amino acid adenylation domain-containing protein, partial [Paenibacillus sp. FSL K6-2393]|uniref:amino acid adenylation domain-containing protein n=1 Tax=Paenibacillus sp. FSL K6-2393 TaxID=2921475 RepID=UPI0030F8496A